MNEEIIKKLDTLSEYKFELDALLLKKQEAINKVYTKEIQDQVQAIEVEFRQMASAANENITKLEDEIRQNVITLGSTVKGSHLMAVWVKGRVSWDGKLLDGLALAFPDLLKARKEGEPSVTIRNAK